MTTKTKLKNDDDYEDYDELSDDYDIDLNSQAKINNMITSNSDIAMNGDIQGD